MCTCVLEERQLYNRYHIHLNHFTPIPNSEFDSVTRSSNLDESSYLSILCAVSLHEFFCVQLGP